MSKQLSSDVSFLLELWLWMRRVEKAHGVLARYSIRPTNRRGICTCYVEVWSVAGDGKPHTRLVQVEHQQPDAAISGRTTALLALLSLAEARLDEAVRLYKEQNNILAAS